ncbi:MAG TPA: hypothetical protein VMT73_10065 [Anaerolineales bacterium]|nr:hypothetical protein [Anaerolineales bacterium]
MTKVKSLLPYLLAILCLAAGGYHLFETLSTFKLSDVTNEMVSTWEVHMKVVQAAIPSNVFVASYLENADIPNSNSKYDEAEFFLVQYGVAPVALKRGFGEEWIIGNFGNTVSLKTIKPWLDQKLGKYTIQDLGFGLYVIHDIKD